ncbi:hypothetical protein ACFY1J_24045 [Streptomyces sp. NPDC001406]|uniref:hypothetical protein n=1 Tax=Streptomyces sp. NPDC001406 TaxID=3364572 RepID=UPI003688FBD7
MGRLGRHTATILRGRGTDGFGDPLAGDPDEFEVTGTSMQPASSIETLDGGDQVVSLWDWFVPPGTDVRATDQVRWRGAVYDVDGDPPPIDDERGRPHHIEVRLRRVTG